MQVERRHDPPAVSLVPASTPWSGRVRDRLHGLARRALTRLSIALTGPLAEQTRKQAAALERLELVVRRIDQRTAGRATDRGRRVPASALEIEGRRPHDDPTGSLSLSRKSIVDLSHCPVCAHGEWTTVCEYNKFFLLQAPVDEDAGVYNYSLCHRCGVVFARRRPVGERYRFLFDRFEIGLGRAWSDEGPRGKLTRTSVALQDDDRHELRRRLAHGVFVSNLLPLRRNDYLPQLQEDRLANSPHIELIGSLLALKSPRVLELRPRTGSIGAALRRLYGASVYAMPLFEAQQLLVREAYAITADHRVDYDRFAIPYEGGFDLIVANHMLTHVLNPREFLRLLKQRLNPGGHVYFYNEQDERDVVGGKLLFNTLNPFHFQTFNGESLGRALNACGFVAEFVSHHAGRLVVLAAAGEEAPWEPMGRRERGRRLAAYVRARDLAILRLPVELQHRFAGEWDAVVERAVVAGSADYDERGRLRIVKHAGMRRGAAR